MVSQDTKLFWLRRRSALRHSLMMDERNTLIAVMFPGTAALDKIRSPLHLFAFDHRLAAIAAYVSGVVELARNSENAEVSLRKAWVIFDRIGYDWRAGRAALALYKATSKDRWLHLAEDKLEPYGLSWLGEELRFAESGQSYEINLPPMQAKVFEMLCRKKTTAEMAQELGLSQHTVRNHLKAVFKAYRVKSRSALVAEAARRGALPSIVD
jgi:DNA-binding CsgD family transcriptional regulator